MGYQFAHVETYSLKGSKKKASARSICAEGERKPENSPHVANPKPPVVLAGVTPMEAYEQIVEAHSEARDTVNQKNGKQALRRMRSDAQVLLAAVASYPEPTETCDTDSPEFRDWIDRSIAFFTQEHGEPLSVVLHLDESHPHIHFLTSPDLAAGQRMPGIHPGEKAIEAVGGKHAKKTEKREAWKDAMRSWQDRYHDTVGAFHAQARLGPQRQRLSRAEWKAQQAELARRAEQLKKVELTAAELDESQAELNENWQFVIEENKRLHEFEGALNAQSAGILEREAKLEADNEKVTEREQGVFAQVIELGEKEQRLDSLESELAAKEKELETGLKALQEKASEHEREAAQLAKTKETVAQAKAKLTKSKSELKTRVADVAARERRLSGFWSTIVSMATLGRMGVEKRVRDAVSAANREFESKLKAQSDKLRSAQQKYKTELTDVRTQNKNLGKQVVSLQTALKNAEAARDALKNTADEGAHLKTENAKLSTMLAETNELIDNLQSAAERGDWALVSDILDPNDTPNLGPELR